MSDRLREGLLGVIDAATRGTRFHRLVRARVVEVLGDGRVETMPETQGTPPLPAVPLRYGLPGVLRAIVGTGARALIGWAEGDPAQPYVAAWDPSQLVELVFDVPGGAKPLARDEDLVPGGRIELSVEDHNELMPPQTYLVLRYTDATGTVTTVKVKGLPGGVTVDPSPGQIDLVSKIDATSVIEG